MDNAKIRKHAEAYAKNIPVLPLITYGNAELCNFNLKDLDSTIFKHNYIKETIQASSNEYYYQHGFALRHSTSKNLPYHLVMWYIDKLGLCIDGSRRYQKIVENMKAGIGLGGEKIRWDARCKKAVEKGIDVIKDKKPPFIKSVSDPESTKAVELMIVVFTESILSQEKKIFTVTDKIMAIAVKLGIMIRMLNNVMKKRIIEFEIINSNANMICSIQKINDEYWMLYNRNEIHKENHLYFEQLEDKIKKEIGKPEYVKFDECAKAYLSKTDMVDFFIKKFDPLAGKINVLSEYFTKIKNRNNWITELTQDIASMQSNDPNKINEGINHYINNIQLFQSEISAIKLISVTKSDNPKGRFEINFTDFMNNFNDILSKLKDAVDKFISIGTDFDSEIIVSYVKSIIGYFESNTFNQLNTSVQQIIDKLLQDKQDMSQIKKLTGYIENIKLFSFKAYIIDEICKAFNPFKASKEAQIKEIIALFEKIVSVNDVTNAEMIIVRRNISTFISEIILKIDSSFKDDKTEEIKNVMSLLSSEDSILTQNFLTIDQKAGNLTTYSLKNEVITIYIEMTRQLITKLKDTNAGINDHKSSAKAIYDKLVEAQLSKTEKQIKIYIENINSIIEFHNCKDIFPIVVEFLKQYEYFLRNIIGTDKTIVQDIYVSLKETSDAQTAQYHSNNLIQQIILDKHIKDKIENGKPIGEHPAVVFLTKQSINDSEIHTCMVNLVGQTAAGSNSKLLNLRK